MFEVVALVGISVVALTAMVILGVIVLNMTKKKKNVESKGERSN